MADSEDFARVVETAYSAYHSGLSVLPPVQDGSKAPSTIRINGKETWKPFQQHPATPQQIEDWYANQGKTGIGFVCGKVSNCLELFDFDHWATYQKYREVAIATGLGPLVERIESSYLEYTPGNGVHWLYYCTQIRPSKKLAKRFKTPEEFTDSDRKAVTDAAACGNEHRPIKVLIETKGEGGYVVAAPSFGDVHPTRNPYELVRGGVDRIISITPEERESLWVLAKTFDELDDEHIRPVKEPERDKRSGDWGNSVKIWEDYNARTSWSDLLPGWTMVYQRGICQYWRRPGKTIGISATVNRDGKDRLWCFTTSTEFHEGWPPTSKFDAYVQREHRGDKDAAYKALSRDGYGTFNAWAWDQQGGAWVSKILPNPCPKGGRVRIAVEGEGPPEPFREAKTKPESTPERPQSPPVDDWKAFSEEDIGLIALDTVECRPMRWLWKYWLSLGGMSLMAGDGGIGKSQVLLWIAAQVTTGGPWADGSGHAPLGDVLICSAEDRPDDTIKPRMIALGADISRITIVKAKYVLRRPDRPDMVQFASLQDRGYWKEVFRRRPNCKLFIVDPLPSYLGHGVNDAKNVEIRNIIEPFIDEIIAPLDICMLANTHLNKSADARTPTHRIAGSIAYVNLPRNVHIVLRDPDDEERRFVKQAKCNNAPGKLPALAFRIERREICNGEGEVIETAIPVFEIEGVELDLNEAVNGTPPAHRRGPAPVKTTKVAEWLVDFLMTRREPTALGAIFDAAGEAGLIGHKKEDGKWSSGALLYQARDRIPELPQPRSGFEIADMMQITRFSNRPYTHWYLQIEGTEPETADATLNNPKPF